jgi:hypothetical protein
VPGGLLCLGVTGFSVPGGFGLMASSPCGTSLIKPRSTTVTRCQILADAAKGVARLMEIGVRVINTAKVERSFMIKSQKWDELTVLLISIKSRRIPEF